MEAFLSWLPWLFVSAVVFFALGWLGARIDVKHLLTQSRELPRAYFQGLNFLLNEQPDQAIEALLEASRQHPEVVELQFALGSLFRRRGEIDRALRVHKALSERSGLTTDERTAALYETALDYHKSGLLDHAEKILLDVIDMRGAPEARRHTALSLLLNLYQQERNWRRAIDIARMLDSDLPAEKRKHAAVIANFHCELAVELHAANASADAQADANAQLDHALREYPLCVRANLLRGQWLESQGRHAEAIAVWRAIEAQDASYLGLAAEGFLRAHQALGKGAEGLAELSRMQSQYPSLDIFTILFKATLKEQGADAAADLVKEDLRLNPTLVGLDHLLEARVLAATDDRKADLETLKSLVHSHASRLAVYLCRSCGFKAKQWYWHCPACNGWDTFPPRRTAEYDTAERHLARLQAEHIENQKNKRG
jgi:lipopolysaccharide biosynthesis regulator YciM